MYPPYPHVRLYVNIYVIYTPVLCMHTGERIRKYLYDIYNCALHTYRRAHGKLALIHTWSNVFHTMWSCAQKIKKRMNNVDIKIRISYLCTYWTTPVFLLRTGERIAKLPGLGVTAELHTGTIKSHLYCLSTPLYAPLLPIRTSIAYTHLYCLYAPLLPIHTSIAYTHLSTLSTPPYSILHTTKCMISKDSRQPPYSILYTPHYIHLRADHWEISFCWDSTSQRRCAIQDTSEASSPRYPLEPIPSRAVSCIATSLLRICTCVWWGRWACLPCHAETDCSKSPSESFLHDSCSSEYHIATDWNRLQRNTHDHVVEHM